MSFALISTLKRPASLLSAANISTSMDSKKIIAGWEAGSFDFISYFYFKFISKEDPSCHSK
jgi:hypothetical protein